jgi:CBS domain-containing protein
MKCSELMKTNVECMHIDATAHEAARRMSDANVGFLPICDEHGVVLGTLTDRDITVRLVANGRAVSTHVREIMTRDIVSCHPTDDIQHAQHLMAKHRKSRIMCLDSHGRVAGIVSLSDIAQRADGGRLLRAISRREVHA